MRPMSRDNTAARHATTSSRPASTHRSPSSSIRADACCGIRGRSTATTSSRSATSACRTSISRPCASVACPTCSPARTTWTSRSRSTRSASASASVPSCSRAVAASMAACCARASSTRSACSSLRSSTGASARRRSSTSRVRAPHRTDSRSSPWNSAPTTCSGCAIASNRHSAPSAGIGTLGAIVVVVTALENCIIYYGPHTRPATLNGARWRPVEELWAREVHDEPAVLIVEASMLERRDLLRRLPRRVVFVAADEEVQAALESRVKISIVGVNDDVARDRVLDAACVLSCTRFAGVRIRRRLASRKLEFRELSRVGMALMLERDREALLGQIVDQGKRLTGSDGGGMLLAETDAHGVTYLRVADARFDTLPDVELTQHVIAIDESSIAGHAALTREPVTVADAYHLPADATFGADPRFEQIYGYYRKSVLAVPMLDHVGRLVGVLAF